MADSHWKAIDGYTTATDSRVDLPTAFLLCRGRSPYTGLGVMKIHSEFKTVILEAQSLVELVNSRT